MLAFLVDNHVGAPLSDTTQKRFHVVRVSADYQFVMVVHSVSGKPPSPFSDNTEAEADQIYWRCTYEHDDFREASFSSALQSISGIADGMGWGEKPAEQFDTLDDVIAWRDRMRLQAQVERCTYYAEEFQESDPDAAARFAQIGQEAQAKLDKLKVSA